MNLGIIGLGNIGRRVLDYALTKGLFDTIFIYDIDKIKIIKIINERKNSKSKIKQASLESLLQQSDIIFEAATKDALKSILESKYLNKKRKKLIVMSVSGLVENYGQAKKLKNCLIIVPSGAVAGLDAIRSAKGRITSLSLTTTKPLQGLEGASFIIQNDIKLSKKRKMRLFSGSLLEAIDGFPQNINVAATLFLASNFPNIRITILSDPKSRTNKHEIICKGSFGRIRTITENLPSKNPKTSYLALLSALKTIDSLDEKITII